MSGPFPDADTFARGRTSNPRRNAGRNSWSVPCTAAEHEDCSGDSLEVWNATDGGLALKCYAGCSDAAIRAGAVSLGILPSPYPPKTPGTEPKPKKAKKGGREVRRTEYVYKTPDGAPVGKVVRVDFEGGTKNFLQYRFEGGVYVSGLDGKPLPLYRLPEVVWAVATGHPVFVTEGEKACLALAVRGFDATTSPGGAGKFLPGLHSNPLRGANVVILPDNDDPGRRHAEAVARALQDVAASVKVLVLPGLPEKGDAVEWIAAGGTAEDLRRLAAECPTWEEATTAAGLPVIDADCRDLPAVEKQVFEALRRWNDPPQLFRDGSGAPVRVEPLDRGGHLIRTLDVDHWRYYLARCASWVQQRRDGFQAAAPPLTVVRDTRAAPDLPLPRLERVVACPVVAPDGTLQEWPGYHPRALCYYLPQPGLEVPPVPERPTAADISTAGGLVLELFEDFPFLGEPDRAHAVALMLTPIARALIDGPTPGHLIEAPSPGSGKTLLAQTAAIPALGTDPPTITIGKNEEETSKVLLSVLAGLPGFVLIDNVVGKTDSPAFASALTTRRHGGRILGRSEVLALPVYCAWAVTGNNVLVSTELARRFLRSRLDTGQERAWQRDPGSFRHPDLRGWALANRGRLVWACLTLIRAWLSEGRPVPSGLPPLGMFEAYREVLGGVLHVAGIPGFLGNLSEFYDDSDGEAAVLGGFVEAWGRAFETRKVSSAELLELIGKENLELSVGPSSDTNGQRQRLGKRLHAMRDRLFGSWRVVRAGEAKGAARWMLSPAPLSGAARPPAATIDSIALPPTPTTTPPEKVQSFRPLGGSGGSGGSDIGRKEQGQCRCTTEGCNACIEPAGTLHPLPPGTVPHNRQPSATTRESEEVGVGGSADHQVGADDPGVFEEEF